MNGRYGDHPGRCTQRGQSGVEIPVPVLDRVLKLLFILNPIEGGAFTGLAVVHAVRITATGTSIAEDSFSGSDAVIPAPRAQWARDQGMIVIEE